MTAGLESAAAAKAVITRWGGAFMVSTEAKAAGKEHGYRGWAFYVAGRCGVLGDVGPEVAHAAMGFLAPDLVGTAWEAGRAVASPPVTATRYLEVCRSWGRARYAELAGADDLAGLLEAVADRADPAGWPLFAAWRAQPRPVDAPARLAQAMQVLREHRGGAHLGAVRAAGLQPVEAIVAGAGGPANATFFGWPDPLSEVTDDIRLRLAAAEDATDAQVAPAYDALDPAERADLLRLLADAARAAERVAAGPA